jgi:hypothetical protein
VNVVHVVCVVLVSHLPCAISSPAKLADPEHHHNIEKQAKSTTNGLSLTVTLLSSLRRNSRDIAKASQNDTARLEEVAEGMCTVQETASKGAYASALWLPNIAESFAGPLF